MITPHALTVLRFGRCELDARRRELLVDGAPRALEPRPFALLAHLLQHRDSTVTTEQLLAQLWPGERVTPGVVANAVTKVRRAIGDTGRPGWIRTVHRVGYRFVGDVVLPQPQEPARLQAAGGTPPVGVVVLPLENLTGSPSLDWVALGLLSLLCEALAEDRRLAPVPVFTIVELLQRLAAGSTLADKVRALRQETGARHVINARLSRQQDGYVIDGSLLRQGKALHFHVGGPDPAAAGRALADWLLAQLQTQTQTQTPTQLQAQPQPQPQAPQAGAHGASDPWLLEVHARALAASGGHRWQEVVTMETVVLDADPTHAAARFELLRARAMLCEAADHFGAALSLWREAVTVAQAAGMAGAATRANASAALSASMCGLDEEAMSRAADGLAHAQAGGQAIDVWRRAPMLWLAQGMAGQPLRMPSQARPPSEASAPDDARAGWHGWQGIRLALAGDQMRAAEEIRCAGLLYQSAGALGRESALLAWWLLRLIDAGRLDDAQAALARLEDCAGRRAILARALPCLRARLRRAQGDKRAALDALQPTLRGPSLDYSHAAASTMAAAWLAEAGDMPQAHAMLSGIAPGFLQHGAFRATIGRIRQHVG